MFSSTDDTSYVKYHTYTILRATETKINGKRVRLLLLRNPWGKVKWNGAYSENSKEYKELEGKMNVEIGREGGKFLMNYEDFLVHNVDVTMSYSQESRTGEAERPEFHP